MKASYLSVFGCTGSSLLLAGCGAWASRGGGFSLAEHRLYPWASVVAARGLADHGVQAQELWCTGLVAPRHVEASRNQGLNLCPLHWQADS